MLPKEMRLLKYSIIILILLSCTGTALAATYTVGSGDTDHFTKIQYAISNASSGDTIIVRDGTYNEENMVVNEELTIRSENGSGKTIVKSSWMTVFSITSANVTIMGFNITGANSSTFSTSGISISGSGCNISDNILTGNYYGLYMESSVNNTLINNTITDNSALGLRLLSSVNNTFTNNTISSNHDSGFYLFLSVNNTFINNTVSNNSYYGFRLLSSSNNNTFTSNTISNNSQCGIQLEGYSGNNTFMSNTVSNNSGDGFNLYYSGNNTLTGNTVSNNSDDGFNLYYSGNNTLTGNTVSNNSDDGFNLYYSGNNTLIGNTVSNNMDYGFYVYLSANNNTFTNNTVLNNSDDGFYLDLSENNTLVDNNVSGNTNNGITLSYSKNNILTGNIMSLNGYDFNVYGASLEYYVHDIDKTNLVNGKPLYYWVGYSDESVPLDAGLVCIVNSTNVTVENVKVSGYAGILFAYTENSTINNVNATGCNSGIELHYSDNNTLSDNILNGNTNGISLFDSGNNVLKSNDASWNYRYGIFTQGSDNNRLVDNVASNIDGTGYIEYNSIATMAIGSQGIGIYVIESDNNVLIGNTANNNSGSIARPSAISDSLSPNIDRSRIYSNGFMLSECINTTLTENTAIGNAGNDFGSIYSTGTVDNLALSNIPTLSFENDESEFGISLNETNSNTLSGKVNVNGYVTITRPVPLEDEAINPSEIRLSDYTFSDYMVFDFLYDDSGMSSSGESSIGLYILNGTSWESVPNASLDKSVNHVSANLSKFGTFALFKDPESGRGGSNPTGGDFNIRYPPQGVTSPDGESRETPTTTTPLSVNGDGEVTGDTIARSSDSAAAVTLYKGTVGTDSSGNPVTTITISTPTSMPENTPDYVLESGLYYDYGPSGTTFSEDVMITIRFDPEEYKDRNPIIYTYSEEEGWIALETTIDWENGIATAYTRHFSVYALFGDDLGEEQTSTDISEPVGEDVPAEQNTGSVYLYWIIGIVIIIAIAVVFVKMQKGGDEH